MNYSGSHSEHHSELIDYFFLLPMSLLISLALFFSPIAPTVAKNLFFTITAAGILGYLLSPFFFPKLRPRLFVGGDLFLLGFLALALFRNEMSPSLWKNVYWIPGVYGLTYLLSMTRNFNSRISALTWSALIAALTGVLIAFAIMPSNLFGIELNSTTSQLFPKLIPYLSQGFNSTSLVYGIALTLLVTFPVSILQTHTQLNITQKLFNTITLIMIFISIILSANLMVWINLTIAILLVSLMLKKHGRFVMLVLSCAFIIFVAKKITPPPLYSSFIETQDLFSESRRQVLRESLEVFQGSIFLGEKLSISQKTPSPNTYFQLLSSFGILGFSLLMGFCIHFIFKSLRLVQDIPRSHVWHRSYAMALLCSQLAFHSAGIYLWTFGEPSLLIIFMFSLAGVSHLSYQYSKNIVPDDYCL